jgi:hypothetical protein
VPGVKTRSSSNTQTVAPRKMTIKRAEADNAYGLISRMLEYESAATQRGIDLASGRFRMLTSSERELYRAELIADYVRLCAANDAQPSRYFDASLANFCSRVCDMQVPSHELIGTLLAAADVMSDKMAPAVVESARDVMLLVLQGCTQMLAEKTQGAAAVAS